MNLKDQRVRKLADVVKPLFRARPLGLCDSHLAHNGDYSCDQQDEDHRRGRHCHLMPGDELAGAIADRVFPRDNRHALDMPPDVLCELLDRSIASLRFLAQRLENNGIEIALQPPLELGTAFAPLAHRRTTRRVKIVRFHGRKIALLGRAGSTSQMIRANSWGVRVVSA